MRFLAATLSIVFASALCGAAARALDETNIVAPERYAVKLENISNVVKLIDAEQDWLTDNFKTFEIVDYRPGMRQLFPKPPAGSPEWDWVTLNVAGKVERVRFSYQKLSAATPVVLWEDYKESATSFYGKSVVASASIRLENALFQGDIGQTLPLLIQELDDSTPVHIILVSGGTEVRDVVIFRFLNGLQETQSGKCVFSGIGGNEMSPTVFSRETADDANARIKAWWLGGGRVMAQKQMLSWTRR